MLRVKELGEPNELLRTHRDLDHQKLSDEDGAELMRMMRLVLE